MMRQLTMNIATSSFAYFAFPSESHFECQQTSLSQPTMIIIENVPFCVSASEFQHERINELSILSEEASLGFIFF